MELTNKIDLSIATRIKIKEGEVLSIKTSEGIIWNRPYLLRTQSLQKSAKSNLIDVPDDIGDIDKFIRFLSKGNIFNKLDIMYLFASNDASRDVNFNRIDFIKPTRLGTYNGGLSYGLGGIKGNGTNAYFGTNFNPAIDGKNYTLNNASRGAIISESYTNADPSLRNIDGNILNYNNGMISMKIAAQRINQTTNTQNLEVDLSGTGLKIINRTSSTECDFINNNIQTKTKSNSTEILSAEQIVLGRYNRYGNGGIGLYFMGGSLTLEEYNIINNAYNNYIS